MLLNHLELIGAFGIFSCESVWWFNHIVIGEEMELKPDKNHIRFTLETCQCEPYSINSHSCFLLELCKSFNTSRSKIDKYIQLSFAWNWIWKLTLLVTYSEPTLENLKIYHFLALMLNRNDVEKIKCLWKWKAWKHNHNLSSI